MVDGGVEGGRGVCGAFWGAEGGLTVGNIADYVCLE